MSKAFASQADLADKVVTFAQLAPCAYAYTAEGDPNTGIVIGDESVLVVDTQATPVMAQDVIRRIRAVGDKPDRLHRAQPLPRRARAGRDGVRREARDREPGYV